MTNAKKATAGVLIAAATMTAGYEGLMTHAYKDSVGVTTICYGETRAERPGLKMGDVDTKANCVARLPLTLKKYDDGLTACLHRDLPDGVHVVFISTTYNIGIAGFCRSNMARLANAGDFTGACHALRQWNMAGGRPILDRRRRLEERDCLAGITGTIPPLRYPPKQEGTTPTWTPPSSSSISLPSSVSSPSSSPSGSTVGKASPSSSPPSKPVPWPKRLLLWLNKSQR